MSLCGNNTTFWNAGICEYCTAGTGNDKSGSRIGSCDAGQGFNRKMIGMSMGAENIISLHGTGQIRGRIMTPGISGNICQVIQDGINIQGDRILENKSALADIP